MFEKLLLAATITFSLNLFIGMSTQSTKQPIVTALAHPSVYLAKAPDDRPSLWSLFQ
jgi:hypothetical protein